MHSRQMRRGLRPQIFKQLSLLRTALYESSALLLCQGDLTALGIKWSELDIRSENKLDSDQLFCTPLPSDAIDGVFDKAYEDVSQPGPPYPAEL